MKRFLFIILTALLACAASQAATRKVVYVVMDGIPADYIERVHPATVFDVARHGGYARASTGGEIGGYSQTPTISAVGYMNILTGTWLNKHNVPGNSNLDPNYNYWSLFRIAKQQPIERKSVSSAQTANVGGEPQKKKPIKKIKKPGRNDPCPCGKLRPNGLPMKYKDCCGRND